MSARTKIVARTAILLALCIASQFLKNFSVYITGPIINCILIISVLSCGLGSGLFLSIITPLSSWVITGSPLMSALPLIVPCVMLGNAAICIGVWLLIRGGKDQSGRLIAGCALGTLLKGAVMTLLIVCCVLNLMGPGSGLPEKALTVAKTTFSVTQLITAGIGSVLAVLIWIPLKKALNAHE